MYRRQEQQPGQEGFRTRLPRDKEIFGIVEELYGGKRMRVRCEDGKIRICRVPGRLRKIWVRPEDIVLVEPWSVESDSKGDIVWRYKGAETDWLKAKGYLKNL